ncbi:unnamed protein product, partial [Meganyctiphanes norvegica]
IVDLLYQCTHLLIWKGIRRMGHIYYLLLFWIYTKSQATAKSPPALPRTETTIRICQDNKFGCDNKCIPQIWRCDETKDCDDGSDELNCDTTVTNPTSTNSTAANSMSRFDFNPATRSTTTKLVFRDTRISVKLNSPVELRCEPANATDVNKRDCIWSHPNGTEIE